MKQLSLAIVIALAACGGGQQPAASSPPSPGPGPDPGPPCEQEIAMVCPEGQIDGCLRTPAVSARHVCVYN